VDKKNKNDRKPRGRSLRGLPKEQGRGGKDISKLAALWITHMQPTEQSVHGEGFDERAGRGVEEQVPDCNVG
jgi:hypothetical protein